ncbi:MAG: hypothetical protein HKP61_16405 [Dactylosporangium sp.]|nr:hypothetical protein [Dactylosporangium sp.]
MVMEVATRRARLAAPACGNVNKIVLRMFHERLQTPARGGMWLHVNDLRWTISERLYVLLSWVGVAV